MDWEREEQFKKIITEGLVERGEFQQFNDMACKHGDDVITLEFMKEKMEAIFGARHHHMEIAEMIFEKYKSEMEKKEVSSSYPWVMLPFTKKARVCYVFGFPQSTNQILVKIEGVKKSYYEFKSESENKYGWTPNPFLPTPAMIISGWSLDTVLTLAAETQAYMTTKDMTSGVKIICEFARTNSELSDEMTLDFLPHFIWQVCNGREKEFKKRGIEIPFKEEPKVE